MKNITKYCLSRETCLGNIFLLESVQKNKFYSFLRKIIKENVVNKILKSRDGQWLSPPIPLTITTLPAPMLAYKLNPGV